MLSHRNLMAMTVSHLADFDAPDENCSLMHGAPMSHGSGLYIAALCSARRPAGDPGVGRVRARRVPRPVRAPSGLQRVPGADHGAAPGADRARPRPAQPAHDRLRRRPDVRRQPEEGDGGVRPDLRPALRPGRGADDDHRPAPRRPRRRRRRDPRLGRLRALRRRRRGAARRRHAGRDRRDRRDRLPRRCRDVGLLEQPRRHRGDTARTAGCTPATWARSTNAATSRCATAPRTW